MRTIAFRERIDCPVIVGLFVFADRAEREGLEVSLFLEAQIAGGTRSPLATWM